MELRKLDSARGLRWQIAPDRDGTKLTPTVVMHERSEKITEGIIGDVKEKKKMDIYVYPRDLENITCLTLRDIDVPGANA